jgi:hypothetical protein
MIFIPYRAEHLPQLELALGHEHMKHVIDRADYAAALASSEAWTSILDLIGQLTTVWENTRLPARFAVAQLVIGFRRNGEQDGAPSRGGSVTTRKEIAWHGILRDPAASPLQLDPFQRPQRAPAGTGRS